MDDYSERIEVKRPQNVLEFTIVYISDIKRNFLS